MYRPEVKVVDCTIRDGGLMNDWQFDKPFVKEVFDGLAKSGVDYAEMGYRADKKMFSPDDFGPWRFTDEEDLREVCYECDTKVSIMADVGRTDFETILPASESIVKLVRVATYCPDIDEAIRLADHCKNQGYEVAVNIMAVSHVLECELDEALKKLSTAPVDMVYLVDSFGCFYSEQIQWLADKYISLLPGKHVGVHFHNNQQLGFANTIEGILRGMDYVDGTIYGIGRAAGNCPLELLMGFLKKPGYDVRPILDLIGKYFEKLRQELRWGYEVPYVITGMLNKHPRAAMAFMKGVHGSTFSEFYDELVNVDEV
ncbi:MAG: nucleoid-structuring protein H-NS [bacterium]|nr:nucleoid-structuring protein H-NS [bacterium]